MNRREIPRRASDATDEGGDHAFFLRHSIGLTLASMKAISSESSPYLA